MQNMLGTNHSFQHVSRLHSAFAPQFSFTKLLSGVNGGPHRLDSGAIGKNQPPKQSQAAITHTVFELEQSFGAN